MSKQTCSLVQNLIALPSGKVSYKLWMNFRHTSTGYLADFEQVHFCPNSAIHMPACCSGLAIVAFKIIELQKNTLNNITLDKHIQNWLENSMFQYTLL